MIMADSFIHSATARDLELQRCHLDRPLVVQFAARTPFEFATATELVSRWVQGIDLNCGCPQGWAAEEGIGACLMNQPQLVSDMIKTARSVAGSTPISVKMRIFQGARDTIDLARQIEIAGAAWITVHGRTRNQKSSTAVDVEMIKLVKENVKIPVIINGDVNSLVMANEMVQRTLANGVMSARALLENPGLFAGHEATTWEMVDRFIALSMEYGTSGPIFHHHLAKMTSALLLPMEHRTLNSLSNCSIPTLLDFLESLRRER